MAWNDNPKVRDVAEMAKKWGADQMIVVEIKQRTGTFSVTSYGKNAMLCEAAKKINHQIHKMIADGTIEFDDD
jgi:hypothetical protein